MPVKSGASFRLSVLPVVLMAQLLAAAVFTLTLVWVLHFRGGVSWEMSSNPQLVYTVKNYSLLHSRALNSNPNSNSISPFGRLVQKK
jgi:hypothetical protein